MMMETLRRMRLKIGETMTNSTFKRNKSQTYVKHYQALVQKMVLFVAYEKSNARKARGDALIDVKYYYYYYYLL